jgi:hypothetical protein
MTIMDSNPTPDQVVEHHMEQASALADDATKLININFSTPEGHTQAMTKANAQCFAAITHLLVATLYAIDSGRAK